MNILMSVFEEGRCGPARLPKPLPENGFRVAALCPLGNPLSPTRHVEASLARAMRRWRHFPQEWLSDPTAAASASVLDVPWEDASQLSVVIGG